MRRREFLQCTGGAIAAATGGFTPARAQDAKDTLLAVAEGGPNSLDSETLAPTVLPTR